MNMSAKDELELRNAAKDGDMKALQASVARGISVNAGSYLFT